MKQLFQNYVGTSQGRGTLTFFLSFLGGGGGGVG